MNGGEEEITLGSWFEFKEDRPACWIDYPVFEEGTEKHLCDIAMHIGLLNIIMHFILFWFQIKMLILSTQ